MENTKYLVEKAKKLDPLAKGAALGGVLAGLNLGKGFPDLDIRFMGIGAHRNWFFHSAATSALLYGGSKLLIEKLNSRENTELQKKLLKYVGAPLMAAFSVANAAHLFADMCGAKDVVGWPISVLLGGGRWKDRIWLGANGIICLGLAWKFIQITLSNDNEVISIEEKEVAECSSS